MIAQLFSPIKAGPNDNLLLNSGWQKNTDGWTILNGTHNTELMKENGVIVSDGIKIKLKYNNQIEFIDKNDLTFSFKTNGSSTSCSITVTYYFADGTEQSIGSVITEAYGATEYNHKLKISPNRDGTIAIKATINEIEVTASAGKYMYKPKLEYGTVQTDYCPSIYDDVKWDYGISSFQKAKIGDLTGIESFSCNRYKNNVGSFTLKIPKSANYANKIESKCYLFIDHKIKLIVDDVLDVDDLYYTVTGKDFKGILTKRETRGPIDVNGKMAYDTISGDTEACIKHYIMNNLINPDNPKRIVALFTIAKMQKRGKTNDSYTSRLEPLDTVANKICENGNLFYDVTPDTNQNKIVFDVFESVDKTIEQRDRPQVIFEISRKNIASIKRQKGESTYKNVFFCSRQAGNATENPYILDKFSESEEPAGIDRNEKTLFVSCNSDAEIDQYSAFPMLDYPKIDYIEVDALDIEGFGTKYDLGDKVTVKYGNVYANVTIDSVFITKSNGTETLKLGFGKMKPKLVQAFNKKINNKGV